MLTEAAWAATRTKDTFYNARYHKLAAIRGKKRALIAVGHSLLKSVYHVLSEGIEYRELGAIHVIKAQEQKRKTYLKKELEQLGYNVQLIKNAAAAAAAAG